jgi:hypothetical protein
MKNELQIVSNETAKLLKAAGFDWECDNWQDKYGTIFRYESEFGYDDFTDDCIFLPTQALAQMWLEDTHKLFLNVYLKDIYYDPIFNKAHKNIFLLTITEGSIGFPSIHTVFKTKQEAIEFGIQKACEYRIKLKNEEKL